MGIATNDGTLQVHKFLKEADEMLGTIDNMLLDNVDLDCTSDAVPQLGTIGEMTLKLQARLQQLQVRTQ